MQVAALSALAAVATALAVAAASVQGEHVTGAASSSASSEHSSPPGAIVIDLGLHASPPPPLATKIAAQACAGLFNRAAEAGAGVSPVYVLWQARDVALFAAAGGASSTLPATTPTADFLSACLNGGDAAVTGTSAPVAKGVVRYNLTSQQAIVPNVVTLAGVLDAVPLEDSDPAGAKATVVFDAMATFGDGADPNNVTAYVYDHYANATTTMAMLDPGYATSKNPFNPPLTGQPNPALIDYIVKQRLFTFFLNDACIPLTSDHALMERMVAVDGKDPWPRPIPVYGYNNAYSIGGDLFEAETNCVSQHNMGQIASDSAANLAFFSRVARIAAPLAQNPDASPKVVYNASKTYMAFVVGDGDNVGMVLGSRFDWMQQRAAQCASSGSQSPCYPLMWSLSPQSLHLAPGIARWYYQQSYATGVDYFVLPPSGDLYSYPSMMGEADQQTFVANTERDAHLMNTSGAVDWEWFGTWAGAFKGFFPKYAANSIVRSLFGVNVPFNFPVLPFFGSNDTYRIVGASDAKAVPGVIVFRPREWRGSGNTTIPFAQKEYLTPQAMADELNGYPKGTVGHIYLTSDGGASVASFDKLVALLDEHVQIVNHNAIADMALARG